MLDHFRLYPTDKGGSKVELDYIRFLSESSYFSDKKIGVDDYEIGSEVRRVIFTHSPGSIVYRLTMPLGSFLSFGAGIIDTNVPTDFEITLEANGNVERIYAKRVQEKKWDDAKIDMSRWQGNEVVITFKTSSEKVGGVAFWSNPVLWQKKERPNVIVYVIDCLRADHVGAYGYKRPTTPHIDNFAKDGALFLNAYSQATWTRSSVTSLMTSQYLSTHKVDWAGKKLSDSVDTIADVMRGQGYRTVIITDNENAGVEPNLDQGFEQVFLKGSSEDDNRVSKNISTITNWLKSNATDDHRNFFMYIQTLELHSPYLPPQPYDKLYDPDYKGVVSEGRRFDIKELRRLSQRDIDHLIALYDGLLNFADKRFNSLIETLKAIGVYDNTIIIVTSDHGEAFNEHGLWMHGIDPYQQVIRVPLIIRFPSLVPAGRVVDENVQLIDIAPTILHMIGLQPEDDFQGLSLLPLIKKQNIDMYKNRTVFTESKSKVALIDGKYKFIMNRPVNRDASGIERIFRNYVLDYIDFWKTHKLFDLGNDPAEKYNIAGREPSKSKVYKKSVVQWLEAQDRSGLTERDSEPRDIQKIDPKVQEELEALGYVQ